MNIDGVIYYRDRLELLKQCLHRCAACMELGVATGGFSELIRELSNPWRLVLVDTVIQSRVPEVFRDEIHDGTVHIHQGKSPEALQLYAPDSFEWIYVDADHSEEAVYADLCAAEPLIVPGGYLAGHDICMPGNEHMVARHYPGVLRAVERFCEDFQWHLHALTEVLPQNVRIDHATPSVQSYVLARDQK
jgi:predicted O-methyltransferase YrrM